MGRFWKSVIIMGLILAIGFSTIVFVGKVNGDIEEGSLAYKVKNAENHIDEVISKTYKKSYNDFVGGK